MKRLMKANPNEFNVIWEFEIIHPADDDFSNVAAATYKNLYVPEGELLPAEKDALINSQAFADYQSFMESVEYLLTDYYDLTIYYTNKSDDNSYYYGLLAKDSDGANILKFAFQPRISNHVAHRSTQSNKHKHEENAALAQATNSKKIKVITRQIIINKTTFSSYYDAIENVDKQIADAVEIMTRHTK